MSGYNVPVPSELIFESATRMAELVRSGQVSPVELVDAHLARIRDVNQELRAFATVLNEEAQREARQAESAVRRHYKLGPLHGVPVTVKDCIETAGIPTQSGCRLRTGFLPERDALVVARLRASGAILLGKTNVPDLLVAYETDNLLTGRAANPWDLARTPGGSSGGEAAAIASGCSAGGLGTDGGGSVRVPAHFCGIVGLKPTPGRIPGSGLFPALVGPFALLGVVGPMARSVADVRLLFEVLAGPDPDDAMSVPLPVSSPEETARRATRDLRVGFYEDDGVAPVTPETRAAVQTAAEALRRQGFNLQPFRAAPLERAPQLWWTFFGRASLPLFRSFVAGRESQLHTITREFLDAAEGEGPITYHEFLNAWSERDQMRAWLLRQMEDVPVLLTPVGSIPAFRHGERSWTIEGRTLSGMWSTMGPAQTFNLLGNPAVVLPVGRSPEGLPIGVQLVGRPYEEELLLAVAARLEESLGAWQVPPLRATTASDA